MPKGVYDRSKARPRKRGGSRRAKSSSDTTVNNGETTATAPYSQFLTELNESLLKRQALNAERLEQIASESDALEVEEAALTKEQDLIRDGLKALEK